MRTLIRSLTCSLLGLVILSSPALAQNGQPLDLEENFPLRMEDAEAATRANQFSFLGLARYDHGQGDTDQFALTPQVLYSLDRNLELSLFAPFLLGNADDRNSGDLIASAQYTINRGSGWTPSLGVRGSIIFPTGEDSEGYDGIVKVMASYNFGSDERHGVHLNGSFLLNDDDESDERSVGWLALAGYSFRLNNQITLLADVWRERTKREHEEINLAEGGVIYKLNEQLAVAAGAGGGWDDESPEFRATGGFRFNF